MGGFLLWIWIILCRTPVQVHNTHEIEEVIRNGKYVEGMKRQLTIRFRSQTSVEEVLVLMWNLARKKFKNV